jgi:hypothetical protein
MAIKFRRGSSSIWAFRNPILAGGEPGFETDTGKLKVGDGFTKWSELPYFVPGVSSVNDGALLAHIESESPHPIYDDGPSLVLLYENAKV